MIVILSILAPSLAPRLLAPLGSMAATGFLRSGFFNRKAQHLIWDTTSISHRNPFELIPALGFGAIYAGIFFLSKAAQDYFGDLGVFASSLLAGLTDVDEIT